MKKLSQSPSTDITIDNTIQLDDNFANLLDYGIKLIGNFYKGNKFSITNNLKADPKGLSVFVKGTPESTANLIKGINQIKSMYPNINYNPQTFLLSYGAQKQGTTTTPTTGTTVDQASVQKANLAKQIYGGIARQLMGSNQNISEEINRIKKLIKNE